MSFAIGLSGLDAATRRLDAAAFDVARASAQRVGAPSDRQDLGAPEAAAPDAAPPQPGSVPAPRPPAEAAPADADLPRAMVDMISASAAFMANLQTIRRADENMKALLDVRR